MKYTCDLKWVFNNGKVCRACNRDFNNFSKMKLYREWGDVIEGQNIKGYNKGGAVGESLRSKL